MKRFLFLVLGLMACHFMQAQSIPAWVHGALPKVNNDTYLYVRESATGATIQEATNRAIAKVFQNTANRIGQPFDSQSIAKAIENGTPMEVISVTYNIPANKVCEYQEYLKKTGEYRVYVLCQVAASGNRIPRWEPFDCYNQGGDTKNGTALLMSVVVPGLGQISKRHVGEGVLTLVSEAALAGTGIWCYYETQDLLNVMHDSQVSYTDFSQAQKEYNTLRTTSKIVWGTAAVLYAYNLCRAFFEEPKYKDALSFSPTLMPIESSFAPGFSLTLKF